MTPPRPEWRHPLHITLAQSKRPSKDALPPSDQTAFHVACRPAGVQHHKALLPRIGGGLSTVSEACNKSTMNLLAG